MLAAVPGCSTGTAGRWRSPALATGMAEERYRSFPRATLADRRGSGDGPFGERVGNDQTADRHGGDRDHGWVGEAGERLLRRDDPRSEEHTSELQSLMRISYAVFCLKKKTKQIYTIAKT